MTSTQSVIYDDSKWPVLLVTLPEADLSGAAMLAHVDQMSSFTARGTPYVAVIDVRGAPALTAQSRRLAADRMDQDDDAHPGVLLGLGIVLATSIHRGVFKAMAWLSRSPRPFEAFTSVEEAVKWARRLSNAPVRSMTLPVADDVNKRVG